MLITKKYKQFRLLIYRFIVCNINYQVRDIEWEVRDIEWGNNVKVRDIEWEIRDTFVKLVYIAYFCYIDIQILVFLILWTLKEL